MPKDFVDEMSCARLFDMYGEMLTQRQQEALQMYYNEDLSLGEIAQELEITRQGVVNFIKKGEASLRKLEEKLGHLKRFYRISEEIEKIEKALDGAVEDKETKEALERSLGEIKKLL